MRFYVDGHELDVQDPKFFIDEDKYKAIAESICEMLSHTSGVNSSAHSHGAHSKCAKPSYINSSCRG